MSQQICRYYLKGACKYGNSCHFLHENNYYTKNNKEYTDYSYGYNRNSYNDNYSSYRNRDTYPSHDYPQNYNKNYNRYHVDHRQQPQQPTEVKSTDELNLTQLFEVVKVEVKQFEERHVWPLTVIAPLKNYGNIPGFKDYSPEEIRYQFYVASSNNSFQEFKRSMDELKGNVFQCCHQFKTKSSVANNIVKQMLTKSHNQFEEPMTSAFQASAPSSNFTFDLNALPPPNTTFTQTSPSFPNTMNSFNNAPQISQPIFSATNAAPVDWNTRSSFPSEPSQPQSQINSFSFNLNNLNNQGVTPTPPSYPFAAKPASPQTETDPNYSTLSELTPEYLQAFQAKTFKYGHIPLNPPPKELCY